jgi:hypothetical protein
VLELQAHVLCSLMNSMLCALVVQAIHRLLQASVVCIVIVVRGMMIDRLTDDDIGFGGIVNCSGQSTADRDGWP